MDWRLRSRRRLRWLGRGILLSVVLSDAAVDVSLKLSALFVRQLLQVELKSLILASDTIFNDFVDAH